METADKILEILKNDAETVKSIKELQEIALTCNFTKEQYNKLHDFALMIAIARNENAMKELSNSIWNKINKEA